MSYGGGGPDWAMIGAKRRAERDASSARSDAGQWRARAEALATHIYETADRICPTHIAGDCQCRRCWEHRVAKIFGMGAAGRPGPTTGAGPTDPFWNLINKISREAEERR